MQAVKGELFEETGAVGESQGNPLTTGMSDLVNDIVSNIKFLQDHPRVDKDKIILIGHSEGKHCKETAGEFI